MNTRLEQRKTMTEELETRCEMVEINKLEVLYHSDM
jgi:hypothetical protein